MSILSTLVTIGYDTLVISIISATELSSLFAIGNRCPTVWQRSEGIHLCIGTELNDHIDGSKESDMIIGLAGNDLIRGGPDDDVLQAGADDDVVNGNSGDDNMQGGAGLDRMYGDSGDDIVFGGFEDDFLVAGSGDDSCMEEMAMMYSRAVLAQITLTVEADLT